MLALIAGLLKACRLGAKDAYHPDALNRWLGEQSGKPVHLATEHTDLAEELKRGLSYLRGKTSKSARRTR